MTNFDYVKTLDVPSFISKLGLLCGCPSSNVSCDDACASSCKECWENWLEADYNDSNVKGEKK